MIEKCWNRNGILFGFPVFWSRVYLALGFKEKWLNTDCVFGLFVVTASEQGSSKSAIEMYGPPSSYNETVNGETLSSISEKSGTYSHPENHDDDHHYIVSLPNSSLFDQMLCFTQSLKIVGWH